jgi:hypothetical protein
VADIVFDKSRDLIGRVESSAYILDNATIDSDGVITINSNGSVIIDIEESLIQSACKYLQHVITFTGSSEVSSAYQPKGFSTLTLSYDEEPRKDINCVFLNKDLTVEEGKYTNTSTLATRGRKILNIKVKIVNNSSTPLTLEQYKLYISVDTDPNAIVEVDYSKILSAEVMMSLNAWTTMSVVEKLETNLGMKSVREQYTPRRDYIEIKDRAMDFKEEFLDEFTEEQLCLVDIDNNEYPVWYTAIDDHPDAYKFVTLTHPKKFKPDLTDGQVANYRYMVYASQSVETKLSIKYINIEKDGKVTSVPAIILGSPVDPSNESNKAGLGYLYKDEDGLVLEFYTSTGEIRQMKMSERGIEFVGAVDRPTSIDFYSDGFVINLTDGREAWRWQKDAQGRITELNDNNGTVINYTYSANSIPYF